MKTKSTDADKAKLGVRGDAINVAVLGYMVEACRMNMSADEAQVGVLLETVAAIYRAMSKNYSGTILALIDALEIHAQATAEDAATRSPTSSTSSISSLIGEAAGPVIMVLDGDDASTVAAYKAMAERRR